jgi:hypothetical protein
MHEKHKSSFLESGIDPVSKRRGGETTTNWEWMNTGERGYKATNGAPLYLS